VKVVDTLKRWREYRADERDLRKRDRAGRKAERRAKQAIPNVGRRPAPVALRVPRAAALAAIAVLVASASLTSFAESYRGLFDWAHEHGLSGLWAAVWPLQVDVFIAVGELALFVALADSWSRRSRSGAWTVTLGGLAVSVAGNVGHVHSVLITNRATAAVPPLAAAAALAVGLGVLKRVVQAHHPAAPAADPATAPPERPESAPALNGRAHLKRIPGAPSTRRRARSRSRSRRTPVTPEDAEREFVSELASGALPSLREIRSRCHVGQPKARVFREHMEALTRI